jgi:hypothetical protein
MCGGCSLLTMLPNPMILLTLEHLVGTIILLGTVASEELKSDVLDLCSPGPKGQLII